MTEQDELWLKATVDDPEVRGSIKRPVIGAVYDEYERQHEPIDPDNAVSLSAYQELYEDYRAHVIRCASLAGQVALVEHKLWAKRQSCWILAQLFIAALVMAFIGWCR